MSDTTTASTRNEEEDTTQPVIDTVIDTNTPEPTQKSPINQVLYNLFWLICILVIILFVGVICMMIYDWWNGNYTYALMDSTPLINMVFS